MFLFLLTETKILFINQVIRGFNKTSAAIFPGYVKNFVEKLSAARE
jgi:phage terminase small subunit